MSATVYTPKQSAQDIEVKAMTASNRKRLEKAITHQCSQPHRRTIRPLSILAWLLAPCSNHVTEKLHQRFGHVFGSSLTPNTVVAIFTAATKLSSTSLDCSYRSVWASLIDLVLALRSPARRFRIIRSHRERYHADLSQTKLRTRRRNASIASSGLSSLSICETKV